MNKEEILKLPAGFDLDLLIAEKIMGWKWFHHEEASYFRRNDYSDYLIIVDKTTGKMNVFNYPLTKYSLDIDAAWQVVNRLFHSGYKFSLNNLAEGSWTASFSHPRNGGAEVQAESVPLAICRAALYLKECEE